MNQDMRRAARGVERLLQVGSGTLDDLDTLIDEELQIRDSSLFDLPPVNSPYYLEFRTALVDARIDVREAIDACGVFTRMQCGRTPVLRVVTYSAFAEWCERYGFTVPTRTRYRQRCGHLRINDDIGRFLDDHAGSVVVSTEDAHRLYSERTDAPVSLDVFREWLVEASGRKSKPAPVRLNIGGQGEQDGQGGQEPSPVVMTSAGPLDGGAFHAWARTWPVGRYVHTSDLREDFAERTGLHIEAIQFGLLLRQFGCLRKIGTGGPHWVVHTPETPGERLHIVGGRGGELLWGPADIRGVVLEPFDPEQVVDEALTAPYKRFYDESKRDAYTVPQEALLGWLERVLDTLATTPPPSEGERLSGISP